VDQLGWGGGHLFLVGCDIFGVLLKVEKVILALVVLPFPHPRLTPKLSRKGKPLEGWGEG
jgi:hypothetical protein